MDFRERLEQFVKRVESLQASIQTEEATKTAVIMPFFAMLGYDVFNPQEFVPEYVADVGIKRGEKVDYAILQEGSPVMIVEAKSINRSLEKHDSQLFRYFSTTSAKFAILTNGIRYRFFTDLEAQNKMDALPFLDFDLLHMRESQIEELKKFQKENFDIAKIFDSASVLKYQERFKEVLSEQIQNPTDDFVRFFLQGVYSGIKTQAVIDRFRPILKRSIQELISEKMNDKIKSALFDQRTSEEVSKPLSVQSEVAEDSLAPTEAEMCAYYRVKNLFRDYVNLEDITYKKNSSYFTILYRGNSRKWICRLLIGNSKVILAVPDQEKKELRRNLSNLYEMENYGRYMLSVLARYTELLKPLDIPDPDVYQVIIRRKAPKGTNLRKELRETMQK